MAQFLEALTRAITWRSILDIAIVSYVFYKAIVVIAAHGQSSLVKGLAVLFNCHRCEPGTATFAFNWMLNNLMTVGMWLSPLFFSRNYAAGDSGTGQNFHTHKSGLW